MSAWHQEDHPRVPSRLHVWPKVRGLSAEVITTEKTRRLFDAKKKELGLEYAAEEKYREHLGVVQTTLGSSWSCVE